MQATAKPWSLAFPSPSKARTTQTLRRSLQRSGGEGGRARSEAGEWRWGGVTCFSDLNWSKDYTDLETMSAEARRRGRKGWVSRMGWSWPEKGLSRLRDALCRVQGRAGRIGSVEWGGAGQRKDYPNFETLSAEVREGEEGLGQEAWVDVARGRTMQTLKSLSAEVREGEEGWAKDRTGSHFLP